MRQQPPRPPLAAGERLFVPGPRAKWTGWLVLSADGQLARIYGTSVAGSPLNGHTFTPSHSVDRKISMGVWAEWKPGIEVEEGL
jgi:hypothetical protein